jgi:hypothetical protein
MRGPLHLTPQEQALARALYASEHFGDAKHKVDIIPPLYNLMVRSLRKRENYQAVSRAILKIGETEDANF